MPPEAKIWFPEGKEEQVRIVLSHLGGKILEVKKGLPLTTTEGVEVYPITPVARFVNLSRRRILQLVKAGRVRGIKPATDWFISLSDVQRYIDSGKKRPGPKRKRGPKLRKL